MPGLTRRILFRGHYHYTFVVHCIDNFTLRNKFFVDYGLLIEENHQHGLHTRLLKSQIFFAVARILRPMQRIDVLWSDCRQNTTSHRRLQSS